ncbi:hypothetical protein GCM10017706_05590 [Lactococcus lactis subsp. hordniae]
MGSKPIGLSISNQEIISLNNCIIEGKIAVANNNVLSLVEILNIRSTIVKIVINIVPRGFKSLFEHILTCI